MPKINRRLLLSSPLCLVLNIILAYIVYAICRVVFLAENWQTFKGDINADLLKGIMQGGWMFDTSAIIYTNALYIVMMLLPLWLKESDGWQKTAKWVFVVCNAVAVVANLADSVYFQFTGRRTTVTVFSEFSNENNMGSIFGAELLRHWYLVLLGLLLIYALWRCYFIPKGERPAAVREPHTKKGMTTYHLAHLACLLLALPLCIAGMRGGFTTAVRPITISNANQYVDKPLQAAIVLNTPFSMIRTIGKKVFVVPEYMTEEEMNSTYSPVHPGPSFPNSLVLNSDSTNQKEIGEGKLEKGNEVSEKTASISSEKPAVAKQKNVVVLIVESFGREYIGGYNDYEGFTPFVDSLLQHSATWQHTFCNGRKSIDGMPSILSSIPMFVEPFFLTPSSMNDVSGLAGELGKTGYYSAFFHGAENGSMGFQAFARSTGFTDYFGMTEYNADKRFGGKADFDGTWAIWDEPFLQFYATKMSEFKEPFLTAVFTASSHHPFVIPEKYKSTFAEEGLEIHKCIRYTDNALRQFFNTARQQPWFSNTLFVLTSDHTNMSDHAVYQTDLGTFASPIIIYDPSGEITPGMREGIAQQIDIMPTILSLLGYNQQYIAFGCDLFSTPANDTWAVNYLNGIYQYIKGDMLLQFDGAQTKALYNFKTDPLLKTNIKDHSPQQPQMEKEVKAIIQSYMQRMTENQLIVRGEE